ncbi:MAG: hypothetical protein NTX05_08765 [Fusobacteria bacterium]|nr:hypothetical protein [Fusobacteriota bacterium]
MVTAYVSGVPSTNIPKKYINRVEFGEFVLLSYPQNLSGSGVVEFKGMSFPKFFLPMLKNDDTSVLINIYTGSKFSEFSLLD